MRSLIAKEIQLIVHPSTYCLVALGTLVLIPSWPYAAILLYGILTAFFNATNAREMRDLSYTFSLPVSRASIVRGRVGVTAGIELCMLAVMAFCIWLREPLGINAIGQAPVGMPANVTLLGCSLMAFGLFNLVFFTLYYKNPLKVGVPFLVACIPMTLFCLLFEAAPFLPVGFCQQIGAAGFANLGAQLAVLGVGAVVFVALNALAVQCGVRAFGAYDA